ncbi:MAG: hypothetical protein GY795_44090 [Desulfobacterales bacterium]|nr:hypothetical protein [Desulfobacterales bacterium]
MIQRSVQLLQEQAVDYAVTIGCEMHDDTQFLSDNNLSVDMIAPVFPP